MALFSISHKGVSYCLGSKGLRITQGRKTKRITNIIYGRKRTETHGTPQQRSGKNAGQKSNAAQTVYFTTNEVYSMINFVNASLACTET